MAGRYKAGLTHVPIVMRDASDREALQLALVENLRREDLDPIEEANGHRRLLEEVHWSQEEMAERVGKSRPAHCQLDPPRFRFQRKSSKKCHQGIYLQAKLERCSDCTANP